MAESIATPVDTEDMRTGYLSDERTFTIDAPFWTLVVTNRHVLAVPRQY